MDSNPERAAYVKQEMEATKDMSDEEFYEYVYADHCPDASELMKEALTAAHKALSERIEQSDKADHFTTYKKNAELDIDGLVKAYGILMAIASGSYRDRKTLGQKLPGMKRMKILSRKAWDECKICGTSTMNSNLCFTCVVAVTPERGEWR